MRYFASLTNNIKLTLSGHDTFPLRYGWLKKVHDQIEIQRKSEKFDNVFLQDTAIADFGVGKNMLNAMRFWSTNTGMIRRDNNTYYNTEGHTEAGELFDNDNLDITRQLNSFYNSKVFFDDDGLDPYLESPSTIWLLHLCLVTNPSLVTYYWLFNINTKPELGREEFARLLKEFFKDHGLSAPSDSTIKKDIECLIQNYTTKTRKANDDFENVLEGPLVELGLFNRVNRQNIRALRGEKNSLTLNVFVYALINCWRIHNEAADTLSIEMCTYDECSPGRVFMLDEDAIIDYAEQLQDSDYSLTWTQSAGIRQFQITNGSSLNAIFDQCVEHMRDEDYSH